ncbi:oxidoreductase domain protein [Pseudopedobacter saltans DSM 12145]|uniref:Oxidoreductase domain protein n=1 Tax=Pseudopedobacter saltans (strain ATCC 51119 / DSM 12145 / JCM 21818 / CCUG 39354 / LMG 10337 / NBRC 100064 / NCIMB 13643) TaxID=762903 RepID=F0SC68_PSESL|nr:Gfo/Idh/MocA family oxidoreductase [Pseudopedobacter saltans]ADY50653.1 oxidoreductase domain protein [Pseudopedobacter saltans DSM 12145]
MNHINWGIIGCGDVTEVKSGPAFNRVPHSSLVAVMRRNAEKAEDYAKRHNVPKWYNNIDDLLSNPDINAIYIATPPSSHEELSLKALHAGKDVYLEKPMALSATACLNILSVADRLGRKLSVAHYRRFMPYFEKVKQLISDGLIGEINSVNLRILQGRDNNVIAKTAENWRLDPSISGGGLFYDLAPHQIDLMIFLFGDVKSATGLSVNRYGNGQVDDIVSGQILFQNNIMFNGFWSFNNAPLDNVDFCEIFGTKGKLSFGFFGETKISIKTADGENIMEIVHPKHVQEPIIERVSAYFREEGENPCSGEIGAEVLRVMDVFSGRI